MDKDIDKVISFWEKNPLFAGESAFQTGSREFFKDHSQVYIDDCFAEKFELKTIPISREGKTLHHLGCEIGF